MYWSAYAVQGDGDDDDNDDDDTHDDDNDGDTDSHQLGCPPWRRKDGAQGIGGNPAAATEDMFWVLGDMPPGIWGTWDTGVANDVRLGEPHGIIF